MGLGIAFTALAAVATSIAALMSYLSIRQVGKIHHTTNQLTRRHATVEFVADREKGLSARARSFRRFVTERRAEKIEEAKSLLQEFDILQLHALFPVIEKETLNGRPVKAAWLREVPTDVRMRLVLLLFERPYDLESDEDDALREFFNLLEDIANGVHSGVYDVYVLNQMYGGLLLRSYMEGAHWLHWLRRQFGSRFYDQTERLIDELILINNIEKYQLQKLRVLTFFMFRGRGIQFIRLRRKMQEGRKLLRRKEVEGILRVNKLEEYGDNICKMSVVHQLEVRDITTVSGARLKSRINELVLAVLRASNGEWPVGVLGENDLHSDCAIEKVDAWRVTMEDRWECLLGAFSRDEGGKEVLSGIVSMRRLHRDESEAAVWDKDVKAALTTMGVDAENLPKFLDQIGMPVLATDHSCIDFDRIAILRSLMVHPSHRKFGSGVPVGRTLFRSGLKKVREDWGRACLLSVMADTEVTDNAIHIYKTEGGQYLGTARDRGNPDGHLMHYYLF